MAYNGENRRCDDFSVKLTRLEQDVKAMKEAVVIALATIDKRLEGMNEFREALKDSNSTFITRREFFAFVTTIITVIISIAALFMNYVKV